MVVLKIQLGSDIRRITLDDNIACEELYNFVRSLFALPNEFSITYTDEENDVICVASQRDWEEALFAFKDKPTVRLVATLEPLPTPKPAPPPLPSLTLVDDAAEPKQGETTAPPAVAETPAAHNDSLPPEAKPAGKPKKRRGGAKKGAKRRDPRKPKGKNQKKHKARDARKPKPKKTPPPPPPRDGRPRLFPNVSGMLESLSALGTEGSTKIEEVFASIFGTTKGAQSKVEHPAICDHCFGRVLAVRYKCGNCANFELCEPCEALERRKVHDPTHVFLKIRDPIAFEAPGALLPFNLYEYTWWPGTPAAPREEEREQPPRVRTSSGGDRSHPSFQARFAKDVTLEDGSILAPSERFTKIWRLQNTGSVAWPVRTKLCCVSGDRMGAPDEVEVPSIVAPGDSIDLGVEMQAPSREGRCISTWRLRAPSGKSFGHRVWVDVVVRKEFPRSAADAQCAPQWFDPESMTVSRQQQRGNEDDEEARLFGGLQEVPVEYNAEEEVPLLSSPCPRPTDPEERRQAEETRGQEPPPPARSLGEEDGIFAGSCENDDERAPSPQQPSASEDDSWVEMENYSSSSYSPSSDEDEAKEDAESAKEFIPLVYLGHDDYPQHEEEEEEQERELAEDREDEASFVPPESPMQEKKEEELKLPMDPFDEMLEQLASMGFADMEKNRSILHKRKGDLVAAIHDLLE